MKAETEIWQLMTHDGVYQADLPTLKQWVAEGLVRPTDRVRKGSLKWIEAQRAPSLRRIFTGEETPDPVAEPSAELAHAQPQTRPLQQHAAQPQAPEAPAHDMGLSASVSSFDASSFDAPSHDEQDGFAEQNGFIEVVPTSEYE